MTRVEIAHCGRTVAGGLVAFDITWDGDLGGDVVWSVQIGNDDGVFAAVQVHPMDRAAGGHVHAGCGRVRREKPRKSSGHVEVAERIRAFRREVPRTNLSDRGRHQTGSVR